MNEETKSKWMMVLAAFVAAGTFGMATIALFFGDAVYTFGKLFFQLQSVSEQQAEIVVDRYARPKSRVAIRGAYSRTSKQKRGRKDPARLAAGRCST